MVSVPSRELAEEAVAALIRSGGNQTAAAKEIGIHRTAIKDRLRGAVKLGIDIPFPEIVKLATRELAQRNWVPEPNLPPPPPPPPIDTVAKVMAVLRRGPHDLASLAAATHMTKGQALDALEEIGTGPHNLQKIDDRWFIERTQAAAFTTGASVRYVSRADNTFCFGVTSDNHAGSKYERLDALTENYRRFEIANVDRVFHCGNYIEGEASFNKHDVSVRGMDAQIEYLVKTYPRVSGIDTWAISGDDHEGWYAQREGIDIGRHTEHKMRDAGRVDWHDLGYMEAHIELVNANTGKSSILAVVHPGGGSSYADSYVIQKVIESLDGGEKPAVALYGHYHKMLAGEYRNVWWVLVPSTKDQDPFMRKKRIRSVVGGGIVTLEQDPETGAIIGMTPRLWRYFVKSYYTEQNRRWSHSGPVSLPVRDTR